MDSEQIELMIAVIRGYDLAYQATKEENYRITRDRLEEWLMEEAIASQISNYLIKPVNPTQIFIACKNILEKVEIRNEHISKTF